MFVFQDSQALDNNSQALGSLQLSHHPWVGRGSLGWATQPRVGLDSHLATASKVCWRILALDWIGQGQQHG